MIELPQRYYVGDVGTVILVDCGTDLTGATSPALEVRRPDGATATWPATLHTEAGATRHLRYAVQAGDLDQPGEWRLQAHVTLPGWSGLGGTAKFTVRERYQ